MNERELLDRTKCFALRVLKVVEALPNNVAGRAIGNQLIRSGTSVGANYRSACKARSKVEFVSRLGVVEEEADESAFWLELIIESELLPEQRITRLLNEANEIVAIAADSRQTAGRKSATSNRKSQVANRKPK